MTLFFPADGFMEIKNDRNRFSYISPTVILLLCVISNIAKPFIVHYPLSTVDVRDVNLFQQVFSFLVPVLLWVLGSYYVTCIFSGESMMREVYASVCYSLLPYAIFTVPLAVFSNVLGISGSSLYNTLTVIISVWNVVLILVSIWTMNSYSFGTMILVVFVSIIAVLFISVVLILLYVLGVKLFDFIAEVFKEYKLLIFK